MKKLLSIFTIGIGALAFTPSTVTACKLKSKITPHKPFKPLIQAKLNLNNIKLFDLKIIWAYKYNPIKINRRDLLATISTQISNYYQKWLHKKLKKTDFMYGTKPTQNHPWAIEVMNIDGKTPLAFNEQGVADLIFKPGYKVLTDNALKVKITTTNQHVNTKTVIVKGYLDHFVYTNANLNQGHDLLTSDPSGFVTEGKNATVFDISNEVQKFPHTVILHVVDNAIRNLNNFPKKVAKISKLVFTALNKQLETETKTLNKLNKLKIIDVNKEKINFRYHANINYYNYQPEYNAMTRLYFDRTPIAPKQGVKLFAQFRFVLDTIPNNNYIPTPKYPGSLGAYLYLYLGETT